MVCVIFSQSGGIHNSYSTVARDLWQRKLPLSSGYAHRLGSIYCHKFLALCYNYNITTPSYYASIMLNATATKIVPKINYASVIMTLVDVVGLYDRLDPA